MRILQRVQVLELVLELAQVRARLLARVLKLARVRARLLERVLELARVRARLLAMALKLAQVLVLFLDLVPESLLVMQRVREPPWKHLQVLYSLQASERVQALE